MTEGNTVLDIDTLAEEFVCFSIDHQTIMDDDKIHSEFNEIVK